ncbi:hypothetical protein GY21_09060 [Cryobacterium roopkundense]|uniref:Uncharacterized protein (DUF58 family) n=1 Tax=Cryobacterium roopkundense TaxID=1001240 RepID=A0A099JH71_9MICO|nr:DUF58 domain-containing protein [Cryobacterium roopkundense]KGJ76917.1 hypothetical protein GY21_09060 [Cryobacterium roopkundense]MBB5640220.1 uncharacterized protein (DUF58 family) [Cryobacterium roopkundense]
MSDTVTRTRGVESFARSEGRMAAALGAVLEHSRLARSGVARALRITASVVTPLGWSMAATVLAAFLGGYVGGWTELVAIAWAGVVLLGAALLFLIGRAPYSIGLEMSVHRVVVGERATAIVRVHNSSRRRLPGVSVEVPVGAGLVAVDMPGLRRSASFVDDLGVPTRRRGVVVVGPVRTVRGDPIGLVRKERVWADRTELFVHPRTISIPSMSTGLIRDLEGNPTRDLTTNDVSFNSLREYVPGDERRSIHWKSTAKTGTLMVRQFEETRRSHLMVVLSLRTGDFETDDEFELAVSVAGSLGVRAIRDGRTVSVVVSALTPTVARRRTPALRSLNTVTRPRLLDDLSTIEPVDHALGLADLAGLASDSVTGISVAFLVCGSTPTSRELRAAASRFSTGVEVVAVICEPDAAPSLRRVGELSVLTVGFLDDLQKSLARSKAA